MKKTFTILAAFAIAAVCLQACSDEQPIASFDVQNSTVCVGERVSFVNKSTYAWHYEWNFGDGHTSTEHSPCHVYDSPGNYTIILTAWSEKRKKQDTASKTINVIGKGDVMFWINDEDVQYKVKVNLEGETKWITSYYSGATPTCGDEGCATFWNVPAGLHYFTAENALYSWDGYVDVSENCCNKMLLYLGKATVSHKTNADMQEEESLDAR